MVILRTTLLEPHKAVLNTTPPIPNTIHRKFLSLIPENMQSLCLMSTHSSQTTWPTHNLQRPRPGHIACQSNVLQILMKDNKVGEGHHGRRIVPCVCSMVMYKWWCVYKWLQDMFVCVHESCFIANKESGDILLTWNRKGNVYIADFNSSKVDSLTCLLSKASVDDSWIWHKKLSHLNFKAMNMLVQKNLVRGLSNKEFTKDGLCGSYQKRKQRKSSFKRKSISLIDEPLKLLHMDLFGPVNIMSISKNKYALVIVDDFTRFSWTFFLHSKDEASQLIINHIKNVETGFK